MPPPAALVHFALFCTVSVGIGCAAVVAKIGLDSNDPFVFTVYRNSAAAAVLLLWSRLAEVPARHPLTRHHALLFLIGGMGMTVTSVGYSYGIKVSNAVLGAAWQTSIPVFTATWAFVFGLERLTPLKVGGMCFALSGALFICFFEDNVDGSGDALAGNAILFVQVHGYVAFALSTRVLVADFPPILVTASAVGCSVFISLAAALASKSVSSTQPSEEAETPHSRINPSHSQLSPDVELIMACAYLCLTRERAGLGVLSREAGQAAFDWAEEDPWGLSPDGLWALAYFICVNGVLQFTTLSWASRYIEQV